MNNYNIGDLVFKDIGNTNIGDLNLIKNSINPDFIKINPDITTNITHTLNNITPTHFENMNLIPDISGTIASVKTSIGNYLSPLITKATPIINSLTPYAIPIGIGIGTGLVSGYYIGKKYGKLKGFAGGLGIGGATGIAAGLATASIPIFAGAGIAGSLGVIWGIKKLINKPIITTTTT